MATNKEKPNDFTSNNGSLIWYYSPHVIYVGINYTRSDINWEISYNTKKSEWCDYMYENMIEETKQFVCKIKNSEVYAKYLEDKVKLEKSIELKQKVDEFRRKSYEIQMGYNYGHYNSYENLVHLKGENEELLNNPIVKSFLDSELRLSKLISSIYDTISDSVDFDLEFLNG